MEIGYHRGMRSPVALSLVLVLVLVLGPLPSAPADEAPAPLPATGELNALVLKIAESYPRDGTHPYHWPKGSSWAGTTRDLFYLGTRIADGDPQGRAYCCGLTFEVLIRAWEAWSRARKADFRIGDLDAPALLRLRSDWYCSGSERRGPVAALVPRGLGVEVARIEDARPGDFVQIWRKNGSGHSVIFVAREGGGLKYWSTQNATNGIGYRTETYETAHIARVGVPARRCRHPGREGGVVFLHTRFRRDPPQSDPLRRAAPTALRQESRRPAVPGAARLSGSLRVRHKFSVNG